MAIQYNVDSVTVALTTTSVVPARFSRKTLILTNASDEDINVAIGAEASLGKGITLKAGGGTYNFDLKEESPRNEVFNAICTSGGKELTIMEVYEDNA